MSFKDYFSGHAADYATYRPRYPAELFAWLAQQCQHHEAAWDCATGNGQAAIALTQHFQHVTATDASEAQISQADPHPQIDYRVALAEDSGLAENSFDLVTVAQAAHWLNREAFYQDVKRVLRPGGVLALWCYDRPLLPSGALDGLLENYYRHTLNGFWAPERRLIEERYQSLRLPFEEIPTPSYTIRVSWTLQELMGYLYTWSATQRYIAAHRVNPLEALAEAFIQEIQATSELETKDPDKGKMDGSDRVSIPCSWPIYLRAGIR